MREDEALRPWWVVYGALRFSFSPEMEFDRLRADAG